MFRGRIGNATALLVGLVWACAVIWGARVVLNYENTPSPTRVPAAQWPENRNIARPSAAFALLLFAHPDCPCTLASLAELERAMAVCKGSLKACLIFSKPSAAIEDVRQTPLWKKAAAIPNVDAFFDSTGEVTRQFGATVSGQTLLYDLNGRLVFSGGVTAARGHEGDNYGLDAVIDLVRGRSIGQAHTPVFGCSLLNPDAATLAKEPSWRK